MACYCHFEKAAMSRGGGAVRGDALFAPVPVQNHVKQAAEQLQINPEGNTPTDEVAIKKRVFSFNCRTWHKTSKAYGFQSRFVQEILPQRNGRR